MHHIHYILLVAAFIVALLAALQLSTPRLNLIALALALLILSFLLTGCATNPVRPATDPSAAPIAVVGNNFVQDAVEILEDYKDFKNGNTGWLYTLEKGLHAYSSLSDSYADAKEVLKTYTDTKGQPFVDRLLALLKERPNVPLQTKMAAVAQLADHVAADKGP